jgi:hypothetical protein
MATTENKNISKGVRRMLGLSLDGWNNVMLWCLAFVAIAAILVGISQYVIIQLAKQETADSKKEFEAYKLTVEGKVADAKSEGIKAGETAGNALVRAEELKAANLALEAQIAPRRLTDTQIRSMGLALSRFSGKAVSVVTYSLDSEAAVLAKQIIASLQLALIEVQDRTASVMPMGGFSLGVHLSGSDADLVEAVRRALQSTGGIIVAPPNSPTGGGASMQTGPPRRTEGPRRFNSCRG